MFEYDALYSTSKYRTPLTLRLSVQFSQVKISLPYEFEYLQNATHIITSL